MSNSKRKPGILAGILGRGEGEGTRRSSTNEGRGTQSSGAASIVSKIPYGPRNHFVAMVAEFVGTFLFLFFAFAGTQVANTMPRASLAPEPALILYIALSFGFSLAVNVWVFFRISGGLFNPAVTLGLCLIGAVPPLRGIFVFIAQMLAGMAASGVVKALFPGPLAVNTFLSNGTTKTQGLFIEMFLTSQLILTIFMLAAEKHKSTYLAPVGIGLALFIIEMAGVYYTGGSVNPARSFGPCVATHIFPHEHWIYWLGPFLGTLLATGFYIFIKSCKYETVNPGQDFDDLEAGAYDPDKDLTRPVVLGSHSGELVTSNSPSPTPVPESHQVEGNT